MEIGEGIPLVQAVAPVRACKILGFGDVSGSEIDFGPRGDWRYFETAGGNRFGGTGFWGGALTVASETVVMSRGGSGIEGRESFFSRDKPF